MIVFLMPQKSGFGIFTWIFELLIKNYPGFIDKSLWLSTHFTIWCQANLTNMMKAVVLNSYGTPESLKVKNVSQPVPQGREILIKIHAAAVNDYDWAFVRGEPYIYRLLFGIFKPKFPIPGMEISGTVEALGEEATAWEVGDEVYGDISEFGFGGFAEYICIDERAVVRKPEKMSFVEAASIAHASLLALQGLRDVAGMQDGQRILINGAGGGVGTFGLQLAKQYQVEVTGVDTGDKLQTMREMGFDHIIDYKREDFTTNGQKYDVILDAKTNRSPFAYARSLQPGGVYATVGGTVPRLLQALIWRSWIGRFQNKRMRIVALRANQGLDYINELFEAGRIQCVIDGPYPLEEVPRLIRYFGEGKHTGKIIISLAP